MRIIQCRIENFGKWSDKVVDFAEGCNVICEENGWGKSTLAAFIRVMFFGFANERKRDEIENERKKYMPWQGGVCGGQIIFEVNAIKYVLMRTFGKKEKEDQFDLRYLETNLKASDFSTNIGEELFHMNQEAFMKTVFISQNDCETRMTDGMRAKIGNLEAQTNDLGNYEAAKERLADAINKMNPSRKTGSLYKLSEKIGELQMKIRHSEFVNQSIEQRLADRTQEEDKWKLLEKKKAELLAQQQKRNAQSELRVKASQYEAYCTNYRQRMTRYQSVRNYFPISLPRQGELDEYLQASYRLAEEKRSAEIYQLTEEEEDLLQTWTTADFRQDVAADTNSQKVLKRSWGLYGLVLGVVLLCVGMAGGAAKQAWGMAVLIMGAMMLAASFLIQVRTLSVPGKQTQAEAGIKTWEMNPYEQLQEKQKMYQTACKNYLDINKKISSYIKSLGFVPMEDLQVQIQEINKHFMECKMAYQEYKAAKEKKESFEDSCEEIELILQLKDTDNSNVLFAETKLNEILKEIDACKRKISQMNVQLEQLIEEKDSIRECELELETLQERYHQDRKKYEYLQKTQQYLQNAKESLSAKYAAPIKSGFDKYYRMLTGNTAAEYKIDVDANLTAEVYGMQRDCRLLSNGYRDLTGLCMRMAFVEAMYPNQKPFLIFDDPFVNLDAEKTAEGLRLLEKIGKDYQVIYFTCHSSRT